MDSAALAAARREQRAAEVRQARREVAADVLMELAERIWYARPAPNLAEETTVIVYRRKQGP